MKDGIKEILESLDKIAKGSYYPEDLLYYENCKQLLDYITNLQEYNQIYNIDNKEVEEIINKNDILKKYFINLKHEIIDVNKYRDEIEILRKENFNLQEEKENQAHTIKTLLEENERLKENAIHNDKVVEKVKWNEMIYKSRNEKAIEYCELNKEFTPRLVDIENILKGEDNND